MNHRALSFAIIYLKWT